MSNNTNSPVNENLRGWGSVKSTPKAEVMQDALDYISRPGDEAMSKLEKMAADTRLSQQARVEDAKAVIDEAVAEIEDRFKYQTEKLTGEQATLRNKSRLSIAPTPEQAAALAYTRDALKSRWQTMQRAEMVADWQAAIDAGDTVTARVYRDFVLPMFTPRRRAQAVPDSTAYIPKDYQDLAAKTDDMLSTPEMKKARAELAKVEATLQMLERTRNSARGKVKNARFTRDGKLVDQRDIDSREAIRRMF